MTHRLMTYLLILPALYLVICAILYFQQESMLFFPFRTSQADLDQMAASAGFEAWMNAGGERIGWQSIEGDSQNTLLICQGNGGFALQRQYYREYCRQHTNWKVFLLEYPGYGARNGTPSEKALVSAATEAIDILASDPARKIWLLGESLGSGVASATVASRSEKIAGLILITPFNSLVAAASSHYPWLPVSLLLRTRFDSKRNISLYPGPVAVIIGEEDTVVPPKLGFDLYDSFAGRKKLWSASGSGHNVTAYLSDHWPEIANWLRQSSRETVASSSETR